jgi:hypothetical protein
MSNSTFAAPLSQLDAVAYGGAGAVANNNLWSGNTYSGGSPQGFATYNQGNYASPFTCGSVIDGFQPYCAVTQAQWGSIWGQA